MIPLLAFTPEDGKERYVWGYSGLSLREEAKLGSKRLTVIPYGDKVEFLRIPTKVNPFEIEEFPLFSVKGRWVMVEYKGMQGFVFDGYLGMFPPMEKCSSEKDCQEFESILSYFRRVFEVQTEGVKKMKFEEGYVVDEPYALYTNGVSYRTEARMDRPDHIHIEIPKSVMSMEEVYLMFYTAVRNSQMWEEGKRPDTIEQSVEKGWRINLVGFTMGSLEVEIEETEINYRIRAVYVGC